MRKLRIYYHLKENFMVSIATVNFLLVLLILSQEPDKCDPIYANTESIFFIMNVS